MTFKRSWYPLTGTIAASRRAAAAGPRKQEPVDLLTGPKLALAGRVVTMDDTFTIRTNAVVYVEKGVIVAIQDREQPAPDGFGAVPVVKTGGSVFPGLIELHNHLSYDALPLWSPVPEKFKHRGEWPNHDQYRPLVSGPMTVLGMYQDVRGHYPLLPALVRYVECKCLLGGVTTSQGIRLASNAGIQRFYRGIVRNVEQTDDPDLPEAQCRIPDVHAKDAARFLARLRKEDSCFLLHLSEGVAEQAQPPSAARKHFLALEVAPGQWALNEMFAGIHAAGLLQEDFDVLASHRSSMVWSPLSNLLLYGGTARVDAARKAGVAIGLGSDWSPTGSKNLLGELKVAWLYSQHLLDGLLTARDLVAMATRDAARILKWDRAAGTLEAGRRADLVVIDGTSADPYEAMIRAKELDIRLVMINGVARYGVPGLMRQLGSDGQSVSVGGRTRRLFLEQATADPDVAQVPLNEAAATLRQALHNIAELAKDIETPKPAPATRRLLDAPTAPVWSLALDEISSCGVELCPRLPFDGPDDFTGPQRAPSALAKAAPPLSTILKPIRLDPLTVADDPGFLDRIAAQPNLPEAVRTGLAGLY
ncbi:MAG TPA: amidohydrolase family protein [Verrucomicrobiota bacterium]|nr:amidohydrolase family protein [Verrucomicrobiota bacterium]